MANARYILTVICFTSIISFFFINQLVQLVDDKAYDENKKKAELPVFDVNRLDYYPSQFESYFTDNFSLRGSFLKVMGIINANIWHKSPKPNKLIVGSDGWLYSVELEYDFYTGKSVFTSDQLQAVVSEFQYRKAVLDSLGIEMCVVIHPLKYSIYPEYLPVFLRRNSTFTATDQILKAFREKTNINIIYTKDILIESKNKYQLYFKGDNHWNDIGGYYAAREIVSNLNLMRKFSPIPFSDFCIDTVWNFKGNLANMAANAELFAEPKPELKLCRNDAQIFERYKYPPIEGFLWTYQRSYKSNNSNLPNVLVIRDSFGAALMPYIRNSFFYSTFIFDNWQYKFNLDIIKQEKPDVVIYMVLESLLPNIYQSGLTQKNIVKD